MIHLDKSFFSKEKIRREIMDHAGKHQRVYSVILILKRMRDTWA